MTRYQVLGRLVVGLKIYENGEIIDESLIPSHNIQPLLTYKSIKPVDESIIKEVVNLDLNGDGKIDSKDQTIAGKVLKKIKK